MRADPDDLFCPRCERNTPALDPDGWRCVCGGPWELPPGPAFDPDALDAAATGVWRYRRQIRVPGPGISLGEGRAPRVPLRQGPVAVCAHLEPTGSFKARGAAVLATWALRAARPPLVEDSSGNAGGALAAYAAAADLACRVYVPASAPEAKLRLLREFGAEVVEVPGPRPRATEAALADEEGTYCSHAWNPVFLEGIKTLAFELWERGHGELPDQVWVPAGQGSLVLGLATGFAEIAAGVAGFSPPALHAVQHEAMAPLARKKGRAADDEARTGPDRTVAGGRSANGGVDPDALGVDAAGESPLADGIAIPDPVRRGAVVDAVEASGGGVVTVDDHGIREALRRLAAEGIWVEPTGAVALAGHADGDGDDGALVVLTGHGLKSA